MQLSHGGEASRSVHGKLQEVFPAERIGPEEFFFVFQEQSDYCWRFI